MKITLLGTGTSQGVPVIGCRCRVCISTDGRDKRLRTACMIEQGDTRIVIDTGPDFRQQMLTNQVDYVDAVLFTHEHKDHVAGLDDVRSFNFIAQKAMPVFAEQRVIDAIRREFIYIFAEKPYPGVPQLQMNLLENKPFRVNDIEIVPIRAYHYKLPVYGFRIGKFAYLTDVKTIPEDELKKLLNLDILVINTLRKESHISHLNLEEALQYIRYLQPGKTYLTHLSHRFGKHADEEPKLPENIFLGYDNLIIEI